MEEELKCAVCRKLFTNPVLLPCTHSLCLACAVSIQTPCTAFQAGSEDGTVPPELLDIPDVDTFSVISDADSGVVCNSRPNSYVGTPSIANLLLSSLQSNILGITCPQCKKTTLVASDLGANTLPKNRVLESIVDKYGEKKHYVIHCQLCEGKSNDATLMCEQCEVFYCDSCRESCHPGRGPLAKHNLVPPVEGKALLKSKHRNSELKCLEHTDENLSMYCTMCKVTVCYICVHDGKHINHDVQALGQMCKMQKTEMSQTLHSLSDKAKYGTEFIQKLKVMESSIEDNSVDFEKVIAAQCDTIIAAIEAQKQQLIENIKHEKELKLRTYKEQVSHCTHRLQKATGLLQFSIEVLKENDPVAFLQNSGALLARVNNLEKRFNKDMELEPRVSAEFEMCLDVEPLMHAIQTLNFFQMKGSCGMLSQQKFRLLFGSKDQFVQSPGPPQILADECSAENNTITVAWQGHRGSVQDGFVLEIDDGNEGDFREVYCGKESICTVEGLHFDSMYNARVKAFNHAGDSEYSEYVCLQTAEVAWFTLDHTTSHPDAVFNNDNMTVTCSSYDDRLILGSVGFSKGIHYWEVVIDRYENDSDPSFGICRFDANKDQRIGKDDKGYGMYIDTKRSWFMHAGQHKNRVEGGICQGAIVGVLLDLNAHTLSFYLNGEAQGPIAFTDLHGVFYPCISLNHNVTVTLHSGLDLPIDSGSEDE